MFEPDILLSDQYRALQGKVLSAEQRLLLAILADAVHCFQVYAGALRPRERKIFREAEEWFEAEETHWFFSFENICALLGLNADYVRRALRRWKAEFVHVRSQAELPQIDSPFSFKSFPRARSI